VVGAARAGSRGGRRARRRRRPDRPARRHRRACVLRAAQLAGDPAVHAAARPRSRRSDAEGRRGPGQASLMRVAIGLRLESDEDWQKATTYVVEAERLGVDFVWSHESWGLDAATPLAFMAARTSRIRLGSGIMQAGTRTPAPAAMAATGLAHGVHRR